MFRLLICFSVIQANIIRSTAHNLFEGDASLSRNDFYLSKTGDDYTFNGTLFGMMEDTTGGVFDQKGLALYRYQRYQQSRADNPYFFFGPFSLLLYGASSFVYELFPGTSEGSGSLATISSFFGTAKQDDQWVFLNEEKIPDNWHNRVTPYDNNRITLQIVAQYARYPIEFGGNTGDGTFDAVSFGSIKNGKLVTPNAQAVSCLLYQLLSSTVPVSLDSVLTPSVAAIDLIVNKVGVLKNQLGCPAL